MFTRLNFFLFIFAFLVKTQLYAQVVLGLSNSYTVNGAYTTPLYSVSYYTPLTVQCYVKNKGTASFTGTLSLNADTLQHIGTPLLFSNTYTVSSMLPGDSLYTSGIIWVTPANFPAIDGGGVTVVVWPFATNTVTNDSVFFKVFVKSIFIEIEEKSLSSKINIYPNPCQSKVFIDNIDNEPIIKIEFYNSLGETFYPRQYEQTYVDVSDVANGFYWLKIYFDNKIVRFPFIKTSN